MFRSLFSWPSHREVSLVLRRVCLKLSYKCFSRSCRQLKFPIAKKFRQFWANHRGTTETRDNILNGSCPGAPPCPFVGTPVGSWLGVSVIGLGLLNLSSRNSDSRGKRNQLLLGFSLGCCFFRWLFYAQRWVLRQVSEAPPKRTRFVGFASISVFFVTT